MVGCVGDGVTPCEGADAVVDPLPAGAAATAAGGGGFAERTARGTVLLIPVVVLIAIVWETEVDVVLWSLIYLFTIIAIIVL